MKILYCLLLIVLVSCTNKPVVKDTTTIGIIPYKGISTEKVITIQKAIKEYYGVNVKVLTIHKLPKSAFINIKSPRYRADSIIKIQERALPDGVEYVLGLTENDISVTKHSADGSIKKPVWKYNDFGIMGLAYCPGKSCIVSGFRLKHKNKEVYFGRFKKVALHEVGHNFGLPHCPDKKCVMTDAVESIKTIDNARPELCAACSAKLGL
jgi:archaemetzincin